MIHHETHSNHSNHVSHLDYIQLQYIKLHPILNSRDHLKIVCRASIIVHIAGTAKHSVMLVGIVVDYDVGVVNIASMHDKYVVLLMVMI